MAIYDPRLFPVIGHDWAVGQLVHSFNSGRMRHAYLIGGPASLGKTTLARAIAMALNCLSETERPCGTCRACQLIKVDKHPDVSFVESEQEGATLKIEQIREMQRALMLRPYEARHRVAIIRRFHEASNNAPDALLKTLEEPPGNAVLILTTENPRSLSATILSRCQPYFLQPLRVKDVQRELLNRSNLGLTDQDALLLALLSGGRPGWAFRAAQEETVLAQREENLLLLEELLRMNRRDRFALVEKISKDKATANDVLRLWQSFWRDALLVTHGSEQWITNVDRTDLLNELARLFPAPVFHTALVATQQTLRYIRQNVNRRLAIEAMLLDYPAKRAVN